jgi:hypothetical protein
MVLLKGAGIRWLSYVPREGISLKFFFRVEGHMAIKSEFNINSRPVG